MANKWTENQLYIFGSKFSVIGHCLFWGDVCKINLSSNVELEQQDVHHMFGFQTTGPGNEGDDSHPAIRSQQTHALSKTN